MITLSMIVKNEESRLPDCLSSVKNIVDEIVIVDTGSSDKTVEIAESFGAKVFSFRWINDFSAARNFALEKSASGWILYLDADETLSISSQKELLKIKKSKADKAYFCKIINKDEKNNRPSIMLYPRLFPNKKEIRFEGAVHEQIENSLRINNIPIVNSSIEIIHEGYNLSEPDLKKKAERNLILLLKEYKNNPSPYVSFQLGQTYAILEKTDKAEKFFFTALEDESIRSEFKSAAYRYLAVKYFERFDIEKAKEIIELSLSADDKQPLSLLAASNIYLHLKDFTGAENLCKKAYQVNKMIEGGIEDSFQNIFLDNKTICFHGLNIGMKAGDKDLFNFFYKELHDLKEPNLFFIHLIINNISIEENECERLIKLYHKDNLEFLLTALQSYAVQESRMNIYSGLVKAFPDNQNILAAFGNYLSSMNLIKEAEAVYLHALQINEGNPSIYFYLLSVYVKMNNAEKLKEIINLTENRFKNIDAVIKRINHIKEKLNI